MSPLAPPDGSVPPIPWCPAPVPALYAPAPWADTLTWHDFAEAMETAAYGD